jgi:hypothetical protein
MAGATVLTRGLAATYPLTSADLGRSISCEVTASNSGGSAVVRTTSLRPIEGNALPSELSGGSGGPSGPAPAPGIAGEPSALKLLSGRLTVRHGTVLASIACQGSRPCRGRLTVSVTETVRVSGHLRRRKLTIATARASLAAGAHAIVKLALDATGRSLLRAGHGRLGAQLTLLGLETASAGAVHKPVRLVRG